MADVPYQSLYRRYRPQRFAEVRGQDHVTTALRNAVRHDRVGHAYLFSGPRGTGKTSTARILAKALNCTNLDDGEPCCVCESCLAVQAGSSLDVVELDAASNNGVDAMRDLVSRAALGSPGRRKVYIVDEVHMLSAAASNALLKTLEEPPAHVVFVLATTDPQKVLATIRSRTQPYEFRLLAPEMLSSLLADVNDRADLGLDPTTLDRVARRGNGSPRDALSALDKAAAAGGADDELDLVPGIVDALAERDAPGALVAVAEAVQRGRDPRRVAEEVIAHLRGAFLVTMAPAVSGVPEDARPSLEDQARRLGTAATVRAMEVLGEALVDMREALDPRVTLEVALIRLCAPGADTGIGAIVSRLEALERALAGGAPAARVGGPARQDPGGRALGAASGAASPAPADGAAPPARLGQVAAPPSPSAEVTPPPTAGQHAPRPTIGAMRAAAAGAPPPAATPAVGAAATPVATPAPDAAATGPGLVLDRDELTRVWGDRIFPSLSNGVRAVYRTGRWLAVEGDTAVFAFDHPQFLQRGEDKRVEVQAALGSHFGARVGLRLVLDPAPGTPRGPGGTGLGATPTAAPPTASAVAPPYEGPLPARPPADDDVSAEEFAQLEVAPDAPTSAQERLLQAFPGTEEVIR